MHEFSLLLFGILIGTWIAFLLFKLLPDDPKSFNVGDILNNSHLDHNPFNENHTSYVIVRDKKFGSDNKWYYMYQYCDKSGKPLSDILLSGRLQGYNKQ